MSALLPKLLVAVAALYGLIGVAMGAFAAHGLKSRLDDTALGLIRTATDYQLLHAVAMLAVLNSALLGSGRVYAALWFAVGIALFSGSLYALALTGHRGLGMVTPLGGSCFLLGWLSVIYLALRA